MRNAPRIKQTPAAAAAFRLAKALGNAATASAQ